MTQLGHDEMLREVDAAADRLIDLVKTADLTASVPNCPAWTVRDAFGHVITVVPRYAAGPEGTGRWVRDPSELPSLNDAQLSQVRDIGFDRLAARLPAD
jgi:hypothetical protein